MIIVVTLCPPTRRVELLQQGGGILLFHWSGRSFESPAILTFFCWFFLCLKPKNVLTFKIVQNHNNCFHNGCFGRKNKISFWSNNYLSSRHNNRLHVPCRSHDICQGFGTLQELYRRGWGDLCTNFAWSEFAAIKNNSLPIKDDLWTLLQQSYWMTSSATHSQI